MLPVSGAEQLKTSGAIGERPITSQRGAYSRFVRPAPRSLSGRKRFQRARSRAVALSCSMIGGTCQREGPALSWAWKTGSFGEECFSIKLASWSMSNLFFFEISYYLIVRPWLSGAPHLLLPPG